MAAMASRMKCFNKLIRKVLIFIGGAFDNGCPCFDDERCITDKENVMKMECKCGVSLLS